LARITWANRPRRVSERFLDPAGWIQVRAIPTPVSVSCTLNLVPSVGLSLNHHTLAAIAFTLNRMAETATHTSNHLPGPQTVVLSIHSIQLGLAVIISCLDVYGVHYISHNVLVCSLIIASGPVCLEKAKIADFFSSPLVPSQCASISSCHNVAFGSSTAPTSLVLTMSGCLCSGSSIFHFSHT
jgi:hypothetical protein